MYIQLTGRDNSPIIVNTDQICLIRKADDNVGNIITIQTWIHLTGTAIGVKESMYAVCVLLDISPPAEIYPEPITVVTKPVPPRKTPIKKLTEPNTKPYPTTKKAPPKKRS